MESAVIGHKAAPDEPPGYNTIAPYAPPDAYPPAAPIRSVDSTVLKGVPPGLEYLIPVNQLSVRERFTVSQGWSRSFDVLDAAGQRMFQATQRVQCCGPVYDVMLTEPGGRDALHLLENCGCTCTRRIQVYDQAGGLLGYVQLHWSSMITHLSVMNQSSEVILLILGPSFSTNIFGNVSFEVKSRDEQHVVGVIRNENEQFMVTFPADLDVTAKALLLGGCFYLDSLIYSKRKELLNRRSND
ncbi:phospholipid scramblase 3-like isoform X1 [Spea bombifrons]|uniref:phospholipid scramblase 3-like isoform X1 n=1 Tax=Spea bombifrons TaxID=233779 RepID=UPI00234BC498|nr:phospholipid scramblase 3-like isoform X1 [Spea bombifrons]